MTGHDLLDRALFLLRRSGFPAVRAGWISGACVGVPVVVVGYFEIVEGLRELRPLLAALLVLGWWARCVVMARVVGSLARVASRGHLGNEPVRVLGVVRTASWVAVGLWLWAWLPILGSFGGWLGVLLTLPILSVRGSIAPSWLARAGRPGNAGFRAVAESFADATGMRFATFAAEGLSMVGALVLFINLFALFAFGTLLARSFLGFDVTLVDAFLSLENVFVLLVVGVLSFVAIEPLRAATIAIVHVEARARVEGFDLRAALLSIRGSRSGAIAAASIVVGFLCTMPAAAGAAPIETPEAPPSASAEPVAAEQEIDPQALRDDETYALVESILTSPIYDDPLANRGRSLAEAIARWLETLDPDEPEPSSTTRGQGLSFGLPPALFYVAIALLLAGIVAWIASGVTQERAAEEEKAASAPSTDPRDRAPSAHLDAAARLAAEGDYRGALRALYIATLVALDRRALIDFQPWRTNGHYVRAIPASELREALGRLTGLFDRTWYGDAPASTVEYEEGRALAEAMCGEEPAA